MFGAIVACLISALGGFVIGVEVNAYYARKSLDDRLIAVLVAIQHTIRRLPKHAVFKKRKVLLPLTVPAGVLDPKTVQETKDSLDLLAKAAADSNIVRSGDLRYVPPAKKRKGAI